RSCGDPRLHGEAAPLILRYRSARRPASGSAEIGATLEIVDFVRQWPLLKLGHRRSGKSETLSATATTFTCFVEPSSGMGHEDPFPRPGPNGRCRFDQETFAGVRVNGRDAPQAAIARP